MAWTVHRLHAPAFLLNLELEHVFPVRREVTGCLPELDVVYVRRDDCSICVSFETMQAFDID